MKITFENFASISLPFALCERVSILFPIYFHSSFSSHCRNDERESFQTKQPNQTRYFTIIDHDKGKSVPASSVLPGTWSSQSNLVQFPPTTFLPLEILFECSSQRFLPTHCRSPIGKRKRRTRRDGFVLAAPLLLSSRTHLCHTRPTA